MLSLADLQSFLTQHPGMSFYVHNGYLGWSYGSPQDPVPISLAVALDLLNRVATHKRIDLQEMAQAMGDLQYADFDDDLFNKTGGNRFLILLPSPSSEE